jgi:hypothetical protein
MSESKLTDTSGLSLSLGTINSTFSELSSNKETIWSGYFAQVFAEISRHSAVPPEGPADTDVTPPSETRPGAASGPQFLERLSGVERKLVGPETGVFHRRFMGRESFRGLVAGTDGTKFHAVIQDRNGDKFEYDFSDDELPEKQRAELRVGSPVVIHIGFEYRGNTKINMMKIYLANYERKSATRAELIKRKAASWTF